MSAPDKDQHARLLELADGYIESTLSAAEMTELDQHLQSSSLARQIYTDYLHDHAAIYSHYLSPADSSVDRFQPLFSSDEKTKSSIHPNKQAWLLPIILSCLIFGLLTYIAIPRTPSDSGVATVLRVDGDSSVAVGQTLQRGDSISMETGLLELVFAQSGVHVVASAPLALSGLDARYMRLHQGELKLHVPPQGIGFVVETSERQITDLGTQFVVTADGGGSKVFVLDGQVAVGAATPEDEARLMTAGDVAKFFKNGSSELAKQKPQDLPEIQSLPVTTSQGLIGQIYTLPDELAPLPNPHKVHEDHIGPHFLPLIQSGFSDRQSLSDLVYGQRTPFGGIAGSHRSLAERLGLSKKANQHGWMVWYSGQVTPPAPGRYRFWGYADNHLLVAIDGQVRLEASRFDTSFREDLTGVHRHSHPSLPCLNSHAGFSSGEWFDIGDETSVEIDILFGEMSNNHTSGLLLIERQGQTYEETVWGQPRWPIFLTTQPSREQVLELEQLRSYIEEGLKGAFSISDSAIWQAE